MVSISDIDGWESGGGLAGDNIHKIIGTNRETGGVLHVKISGPTEYQSTTYTVAVQQPGDAFPEEYVARGIKDEVEAEMKALEYARNN